MREWEAFYWLEPFGEERADLRMGILAAVVANYSGNVNTDTHPQAFRPQEFMPFHERPKVEQVPASKVDEVKRFAAEFERLKQQ